MADTIPNHNLSLPENANLLLINIDKRDSTKEQKSQKVAASVATSQSLRPTNLEISLSSIAGAGSAGFNKTIFKFENSKQALTYLSYLLSDAPYEFPLLVLKDFNEIITRYEREKSFKDSLATKANKITDKLIMPSLLTYINHQGTISLRLTTNSQSVHENRFTDSDTTQLLSHTCQIIKQLMSISNSNFKASMYTNGILLDHLMNSAIIALQKSSDLKKGKFDYDNHKKILMTTMSFIVQSVDFENIELLLDWFYKYFAARKDSLFVRNTLVSLFELSLDGLLQKKTKFNKATGNKENIIELLSQCVAMFTEPTSDGLEFDIPVLREKLSVITENCKQEIKTDTVNNFGQSVIEEKGNEKSNSTVIVSPNAVDSSTLQNKSQHPQSQSKSGIKNKDIESPSCFKHYLQEKSKSACQPVPPPKWISIFDYQLTNGKIKSASAPPLALSTSTNGRNVINNNNNSNALEFEEIENFPTSNFVDDTATEDLENTNQTLLPKNKKVKHQTQTQPHQNLEITKTSCKKRISKRSQGIKYNNYRHGHRRERFKKRLAELSERIFFHKKNEWIDIPETEVISTVQKNHHSFWRYWFFDYYHNQAEQENKDNSNRNITDIVVTQKVAEHNKFSAVKRRAKKSQDKYGRLLIAKSANHRAKKINKRNKKKNNAKRRNNKRNKVFKVPKKTASLSNKPKNIHNRLKNYYKLHGFESADLTGLRSLEKTTFRPFRGKYDKLQTKVQARADRLVFLFLGIERGGGSM
ncbi:hypothetical protein PACTADRAFT_2738 [Pachysolen tannophilus NRRL Y-2460]|uniref:Uncharacterized protein n=1 Tax=Pachysolen tannophilus NRRL Y-2460 TaxID=669874 RepID=A0A1E4TXF8_PACTA|nr:hypothetical protein PACTADRAFT_2738 [Pachysolen tannophilus NRRL Y-2460]